MDVTTWLEDWLLLRKAELRPRTIESYQDLIRRYIIPEIGTMQTEELKPEHIRHLLAGIVAAGHTRTAELVFVLLSCAFDELENSPMHKIKRPKHHQTRPEPWTDAQIDIYLTACRTHRHGLALALGLILGLRRGEICGLRWQDVDFTVGEIHVCNQRVRLAGGEIVDSPPKSASGNRIIPIPDQLLPWLKSARGLPSAYLCRLTPSGLDQAHRKLAQRLDLPAIPLHGLRHSMATATLRHGKDMRSIQAILGHASYTTTANFYTHPDSTMLKASLDAYLKSCYTGFSHAKPV